MVEELGYRGQQFGVFVGHRVVDIEEQLVDDGQVGCELVLNKESQVFVVEMETLRNEVVDFSLLICDVGLVLIRLRFSARFSR